MAPTLMLLIRPLRWTSYLHPHFRAMIIYIDIWMELSSCIMTGTCCSSTNAAGLIFMPAPVFEAPRSRAPTPPVKSSSPAASSMVFTSFLEESLPLSSKLKDRDAVAVGLWDCFFQ